jgi:hypothetical protein
MTTTETQEPTDPRLDSLRPFFASCEKNFKDYHNLKSQVDAAEGDREAALKAWMDNSTDPEATAIRNAVQNALDKLRTLAESAVGDQQISEEEKARLKTELAAVEKRAKASSRSLRGLAEPFDLDVTPMLAKLGDPFLPKAPTGTGSGLPRPSVIVECRRNRDPKQTMTFENLSQAAKHMDITVEDLGKLYAQTAGVAYEEIAKVDTPQEFTYQSTREGAPHWDIRTTPKKTARGRQAVETQETPAQGQGTTADERREAGEENVA